MRREFRLAAQVLWLLLCMLFAVSAAGAACSPVT